jgi:hypothetical protein
MPEDRTQKPDSFHVIVGERTLADFESMFNVLTETRGATYDVPAARIELAFPDREPGTVNHGITITGGRNHRGEYDWVWCYWQWPRRNHRRF